MATPCDLLKKPKHVLRFLILSFLFILISASASYQPNLVIWQFFQQPENLFHKAEHLGLLPELDKALNDHDPALLKFLAYKQHRDAKYALAIHYLKNKNNNAAEKLLLNAWQQGNINAGNLLVENYIKEQKWHQLKLVYQDKHAYKLKSQEPGYIALMGLRETLPVASDTFSDTHQFSTQFNEITAELECDINILTMTTSWNSLLHAKSVIAEFKVHSALEQHNVCFSKPVYVSADILSCSTKSEDVLHCNWQYFAKSTLLPDGFDNLIVFADRGIANTNNGIISLDLADDKFVLMHELMHLFGFIDEYKLKARISSTLCQTEVIKRIGENILLSPDKIAEEKLSNLFGKSWYPAKTCADSDVFSYKWSKKTSIMEYQELPLTDNYLTYVKQQLSDYNKYNSAFSYYFYKLTGLDYWLNYAIAQKNYTAISQKALLAENSNDIKLAIELLEQLDNWPLVFSRLGQLYIADNQLEKAKIAYEKAALAGDSFGQYFLSGIMCNDEYSCLENNKYLLASVKQSNPLALYKYALICENKGSPKVALTYFKKAKQAGHYLADNSIKRLYNLLAIPTI